MRDVTFAKSHSAGRRESPETERAKAARRWAQTPPGRRGRPDDVANMVLFLSPDASSWITGQVYPVNGGFTFAL